MHPHEKVDATHTLITWRMRNIMIIYKQACAFQARNLESMQV
jgi:hypothetical protein